MNFRAKTPLDSELRAKSPASIHKKSPITLDTSPSSLGKSRPITSLDILHEKLIEVK
jgi:hypothetical protein